MQKVNVVAITTATLEEKTNVSLKVCSLNYYLLQNTCKAEDASSKPVYGIRVELTNKGALIDSAEISDVTSSMERGKFLLSLLSKNTVTPTSLLDVIEDYLVIEYEYNYDYSSLEETA
jgi:hypothetical protein